MRKPKKSESVNTNEWMNTYADTVTLLMCFFVLLFSFSTVNEQKWKAIVESFHLKPNASATQKVDLTNADLSNLGFENNEGGTGAEAEGSQLTQDKLYNTIKDYIDKNDLSSKIELIKNENIITVRFKDTILFDPDKTYLREDGKAILNEISKPLKSSIDLIKIIRIEGHTASSPKGMPEFTNTFEFSTERAVNVLQYMITVQNIAPLKLSAVGYGQYHPIASNDTEEGRAKNRRAEIIVESYLQDHAPSTGSTGESKSNT